MGYLQVKELVLVAYNPIYYSLPICSISMQATYGKCP